MEELDIREILSYFWEKIFYFFIIILIILILGCVYSIFIQKPFYTSKTSIVLTGFTIANGDSTITQTDLNINSKLVSTYQEIVKSRRVLSQVIDRLELDYTRKIDELSFGNRKKVGIVCALQHKPKLYILDEPTSGLDPIMQREFYSIMQERNDEGATVFLSSHILSEISKYCKTASIIREGKLLLTDKVENLSYTGVKRISLKNLDTIPMDKNIRNVKQENETVNFLYSGSTKELMNILSSLSFSDITISDSDLEDVFMHYYVKE